MEDAFFLYENVRCHKMKLRFMPFVEKRRQDSLPLSITLELLSNESLPLIEVMKVCFLILRSVRRVGVDRSSKSSVSRKTVRSRCASISWSE